MKKSLLLLGLAAAVTVTGCSRKHASHPLNSVTAQAIRVLPRLDTSIATDALPPSGSTAAVEVSLKVTNSDEDRRLLQDDDSFQNVLNQAVQKYQAAHGSLPQDLHELVQARLIASIPTPPQGGRYAVNPQTQAVVWSRN